MADIKVFKFGGSSVGSPQNIEQVLQIIKGAQGKTIVVVSAMAGVTDQLLSSAKEAAEGNLASANSVAAQIRQRYQVATTSLVSAKTRQKKLTQLAEDSLDEFLSICRSISVLREITPRILDATVARGERFSAALAAESLQDQGISASYLDSTEVIYLNRVESRLSPDYQRCQALAKQTLLPCLQEHDVVVMPGFIGRSPDGEVRTLGRGGSDYTATLLAYAVDATEVTLFKEVDGMLTADPRYVKDARVVPEMHFREAAELAFYGAKVLHPRTMTPLIEKKIPLTIKSSFRPQYRGTTISDKPSAESHPVKALTAMTDQVLVSIYGTGMMGIPGIAARAFTALSHNSISISFISQSSSEASICFVVPNEHAEIAVETLENAFKWELKHRLIDQVTARPGIAVVAVVGNGMVGTPGIAAKTFAALSKIDVSIVAIAQGSSELNISFAIEEGQVAPALSALHQQFQLDKMKPLPHQQGHTIELCLYGIGQIGLTLLDQIAAQADYFSGVMATNVKTIALADSSGFWIHSDGIPTATIQLAKQRKTKHAKLLPHEGSDVQQKSLRDGLDLVFDLPMQRGIFVDLTADDTIHEAIRAVSHNLNVVFANKKPLAAKQELFDQLFAEAEKKGLSVRYEATVGAGLPILDTLAKLASAGDKIISISGCLSGTLGYIMSALENGQPFSEVVRDAFEKGFTEPDPREDLSGNDVARKALILARTMGMKLELADIAVTPLFTPEQDHSDPQTFLENLRSGDERLQKMVGEALSEQKTLRYVATIEENSVRVGIEAVPENSPLGSLRGTNNQVIIRSNRYDSTPLIVTGPGAGAEVTAAGVLNDIVAISQQEG